MGDIDHGATELLVQALDLDAHVVAQLRIEVGKRLIEEIEDRITHDGAADGHALALAARQLAREAGQQMAYPQHFGSARHTLLHFRLRHLARAQPEGHVVLHVEIGVERVVLEHHGDVAVAWPGPGHVLSADLDGARACFFQSCDRP